MFTELTQLAKSLHWQRTNCKLCTVIAHKYMCKRDSGRNKLSKERHTKLKKHMSECNKHS